MGRYYLRVLQRVYLLAEIIVEAETPEAARLIGETVGTEHKGELEWETIEATDYVDSVSECEDPPQWLAVNGNVVKVASDLG
jgi:hypothetical protein